MVTAALVTRMSRCVDALSTKLELCPRKPEFGAEQMNDLSLNDNGIGIVA